MAAALVGGAFLSASLQVLFNRMVTPEFLNLFRERKSDAELLKKLKTKLSVVRAVLEDAENKETANQGVKEWLEDLHHTVLEAEDLLDKINTEALRVKVETEYQSPGSQVSSTTCISSLSNEFLNGMMPRIENIVASLEGFIQDITPLGLQVGESKRQSYRQPSTSLVDDVTYGRDGDKEKIVQTLLSDDDVNGGSITAVPIVGLGGIGKTTLAQQVYQDQRVKQHFPATRAWVCVSEEYDAARITKDLLRELNISFSDSGENLNSLQVKLQNALNQKKFLFVLDDVWNSNYNDWDNLRIPFKGCSRGSKIIVTTRDQNVARMIGKEESIHLLDFMTKEDCWSLFKKHVFENRDGNDQNPEFEETGKKIVHKCGGLPLAVKTVAGLLRSKRLPEEWKDVLASELWSQTYNQHGILPALRLSYMHLPSYLKRCFAFCAVFPKDYNFEKEEVIQLWLANDLLGHPGNNRPMGEECFRELRLRSLFQQITNNSFTMHDLVNDLARFISGKYCLRLEDYHKGHGTIARLNHFSYICSYYDTYDKFKLLEQATDLRTFRPLSKYPSDYLLSNKFLHDMLPSFKSLRVVSLCRYSISNLPDSFSGLKQLRLLDLSSTLIQKLPECICTFYNLQTLLLSDCKMLEELPIDMGKLVNLSYLDISGVPLKSMPTKMGRLRNLTVLTAFVVGKDSGSTIEELGKLPKLSGKLFLSGLENVSCGRDSSMANMKDKECLEDLALKWNGDVDNSKVVRDVLGSLEPHSRIKHLKINGYRGTSFPDWVGSPSFHHMKSLSLYYCQYCFELPALGQLQSLESLEIVGISKIPAFTEELYGDVCEFKPFPSLKIFRIEKMLELERWDIPAKYEVFCDLKELRIIDCPELVGSLPKELSSLEILEISGCDKLVLPNGQLSVLVSDNRQLSSLRELNISALKNLKELWPAWNLVPSLERLEIRDCESLLTFPIGDKLGSESENLSFQGGSRLEKLIIEECNSLKVIPLGLFPMLKGVLITYCKSIEMLLSIPPCGIQGSASSSSSLASLTYLEIWCCKGLMSFPEGGLTAPNLTNFYIRNCKKLKSLPKQMESLLPSLIYLNISDCPKIECFPEGGLPSTLQSLSISYCKKLMTRPREWDLQRLTSLTYLTIGGMRELVPNEDWLLPYSIECLHLWDGGNVKMLNYSNLRHLTSLKTLIIRWYLLLQSLPDEGLPASLTRLDIMGCPHLKRRLEWEKGQDWPKVAHIPCLVLDDELVP